MNSRVRPPRRPRPPAAHPDDRVLGLQPKALWDAFAKEPASFWFLCAYIFVEYVRPQGIVPWIDFLPWGQLTLLLTILAYANEGFRMRRPHALDKLFGAFVGAWLLSVGFGVDPAWSLDNADVFVNWILLYLLVSHIVVTPRRFLIFVLLFLIWSFKIAQHGALLFVASGFRPPAWGVWGPKGWFNNPGELGIQMLVLFSMSFFFFKGLSDHLSPKLRWGLIALVSGSAAITVFISNSRGSQLALAVMLLFMVLQSRARVRTLIAAGATVVAFWTILPEAQRQRFETMGDDETSVARTTYWRHGVQITNEHPVFGIGYENWVPYYTSRTDLMFESNANVHRGQLPHNIFIEASAELGYLGLGTLLALMGGVFVTNWGIRRRARAIPRWGPFISNAAYGLDLALVGYMIAGFFVTVLYYPYLWATLGFVGALAEVARRAERSEMAHHSKRQPLRRRRVVRTRNPAQVVPASPALRRSSTVR